MSIREIFPVKIWQSRVENFSECQREVQRSVDDAVWDYYQNREIKTQKFTRTNPFDGDVLMDYKMVTLLSEIQKAIIGYKGEDFITDTTYSSSWITKYDLGDYSYTHTHQGASVRLSGIYYHKLSEKNTFSFFNHNLFQREEPEIEEGDILIFPSDLPHCVNKTTLDEERIALSFNIY
jgi:hypothetical protein